MPGVAVHEQPNARIAHPAALRLAATAGAPAGGSSRRPAFVHESLLDGGGFGSQSVDRNLAWRVDAELRKLASVEAQLDLVLGRGLARLRAAKGHRDLGHSRQVDFTPARYGFSWAHAR